MDDKWKLHRFGSGCYFFFIIILIFWSVFGMEKRYGQITDIFNMDYVEAESSRGQCV